MNLLKITTTPLKISVSVEKPRLEPREPMNAIPAVNKKMSKKTKNNETGESVFASNLDVFQANQSTPVAFGYIPMKLSAVNGYREDLIHDNIVATHGGEQLATVMNKRLASKTPQVAYMPVSKQGDVKWEPATMDFELQSMQYEFETQQMEKEFQFMSRQLSFEIVQYPSVQIEFIGDPIYAPPSSNPKFQEE